MTIERTVALLVTLALSVPAVYAASPADFPNKPVRIVTSEPGGSLDFTARVMAQDLTASLGQQVIVENRGGASGAILAQMVARASPDGYTMLYYGSPLWILPLLQRTSYDAMRDFSPITIAISSPNILVVHPSLPVKTVAELIALAQAKPGQLNYGTGATGGPRIPISWGMRKYLYAESRVNGYWDRIRRYGAVLTMKETVTRRLGFKRAHQNALSRINRIINANLK